MMEFALQLLKKVGLINYSNVLIQYCTTLVSLLIFSCWQLDNGVWLFVNVSLSVVNANSDVYAVVVASNVTLSCHVNNSKKIMWESTKAFSVDFLTSFGERYFVQHMNGKSELTIINIQHCDAGYYRCRFVKSKEPKTCEFLLITIGKYNAWFAKIVSEVMFLTYCFW